MGNTSIWVVLGGIVLLAVGLLVLMPGGGGDTTRPSAEDSMAPVDETAPALPDATTSGGTGG